MKKILLLILLIPLGVVASSYDIEYQRVYNKIVSDNNVLNMKITAGGQVLINFPSFNSNSEKSVSSQLKPMQIDVDGLVGKILAKKANPSLDRKLKFIKSDHLQSRFYSSEVDQFTVVISKDGQELWQYSFYNLEELKHYYEQLGEWQALVDLVLQMQMVVIDGNNQLKAGGEQ